MHKNKLTLVYLKFKSLFSEHKFPENDDKFL